MEQEKEYELASKKEKEYELVNISKMEYANPVELQQESLEPRGNLPDILYIFFDKKEIGIKLIYLDDGEIFNPNTGKMVKDAILVDASRMEIAEWNDEINIPNKSVNQLCKVGTGVLRQRVRTMMVSPSQMQEIMRIIDNSEDFSHIILPTSIKKLNYDIISDNKESIFDKSKIANVDKKMDEETKKDYEHYSELVGPFNPKKNINNITNENTSDMDKTGFENDYLGSDYEKNGKRNGK